MKMDFHKIIPTLLFIALAACGQNRTASRTFQKAADECLGAVIPNQFVAKFFDGHIQKIHAPSKENFINGYLSEHLDQIAFAEHDFYQVLPRNIIRADIGTAQADNWGAARISADALWAQNIRGQSVTVAVIDTGVDITHPMLKNRIAINSSEVPGNGIDDDGNGYIDDVSGYDFVNERGLTADNQFHGTHVAGIIAAEHNDNKAMIATYVQGTAPQAKILPLAFLDANGAGSMADGVRAIKYAVQRGARVINASWGGPTCSQSLQEAIRELEAQNVMFIAAAGNDAHNIDRIKSFPASLDLAAQITIGATGYFDNMSIYSNYGQRSVHLFAPGDEIISTFPGGKMVSLDGTSMATPFVSGAIALLMGAEPAATLRQIRQALYNSANHSSDYLNASQGRLRLTDSLNELRRIINNASH